MLDGYELSTVAVLKGILRQREREGEKDSISCCCREDF